MMQQHREQSLARILLLGYFCRQLCGKPHITGATIGYNAVSGKFLVVSEGLFEEVKSEYGEREGERDDEDLVEIDNSLSFGFSGDDESDVIVELSDEEEEEDGEGESLEEAGERDDVMREEEEEGFEIEQLKVMLLVSFVGLAISLTGGNSISLLLMEVATYLSHWWGWLLVSLVEAAISLTGGGGCWSHWWGQLLVSLVGVAISLTGGNSISLLLVGVATYLSHWWGWLLVSLVEAAISLTGGGGYWSHWWRQLLVSLVGVAIGLTGGGSY